MPALTNWTVPALTFSERPILIKSKETFHIMPNPDGTLTPKEQKVVDAYESAQPELGAIAERNIRNNDRTGWADIIADTPDEELVISSGTASNSFMYRRIGG
jgi:hypothetical protein